MRRPRPIRGEAIVAILWPQTLRKRRPKQLRSADTMGFTEEGRQRWHAERAASGKDGHASGAKPVHGPGTCMHCGCTFPVSEGIRSHDAVLCGTCH